MRNLVIFPNITVREYESLDKYFSEVEKIRPITPEEEMILAEKIKQGDQVALERLTKANLRFVISVAKRYQHMGLTLGDLINEGNMGLIAAAKRYDETKGFKFISYAVWWIRQSIVGALAVHARIIRLPYNKLALLNKLYKAHTQFEQEYCRKPTLEELAGRLGMPETKVVELLRHTSNNVALNEPFNTREDLSPLEMLRSNDASSDDKVMYDSIKAEIEYSMRILNERERNILVLFFGLSSTPALRLEEIGERYNITKEHTRRLKDQALQKLRNCSNAPVLLSCLN